MYHHLLHCMCKTCQYTPCKQSLFLCLLALSFIIDSKSTCTIRKGLACLQGGPYVARRQGIAYFEEIHDGKLVLDSRSCILHSEVIPLCVFVCVQIISQPQLVFSVITKEFKGNQSHKITLIPNIRAPHKEDSTQISFHLD